MNFIPHEHICRFKHAGLKSKKYCIKKQECEDYKKLSDKDKNGIPDPCDYCENFIIISK